MNHECLNQYLQSCKTVESEEDISKKGIHKCDLEAIMSFYGLYKKFPLGWKHFYVWLNLNIYVNGKKTVFEVLSSKIVINDRSTTLLQVDRKVLYLLNQIRQTD